MTPSPRSSANEESIEFFLMMAASWVTLSVSAILSLAILGSAILISGWSTEISFQLALLAIVNPLLRFQQFIRRLCYLQDRQAVAAAASFLSAVALSGGATVFFFEELLSAPAGVLLWGLGAVATIFTGFASGVWRPGAPRFRIILGLARQLWNAGRWLLGANLVSWINNLGMLPLAAIYAGPAAAGILRALQTLFVPLTLGNGAINTMLLPRLAEIAADEDRYRLRPVVRLTLVLYAGIALAYMSVILVKSENLVAFVYHNAAITASVGLLWPLSLVYVVEGATVVLGMILLAEARVRAIFLTRTISGLLFLLSVVALAPQMGIAGVVWAMVVSVTATAVMFGFSVFDVLFELPRRASTEMIPGLTARNPRQ